MVRINWAGSYGTLRLTRQLATVLIAGVLAGCAATETILAKKDLDVQAKTSTAVFVDAVPKEKRTIFLDIKSGVMEFDRRQFKDFGQFLNRFLCLRVSTSLPSYTLFCLRT